jgi:hypothetical protein
MGASENFSGTDLLRRPQHMHYDLAKTRMGSVDQEVDNNNIIIIICTCTSYHNWGEPHISGTAVRELYTNRLIIVVRRSHEIYAQHGSMDKSTMKIIFNRAKSG